MGEAVPKWQKSMESKAWSASIRAALIDFAKEATRERGATEKAAKALGVTRSAIEKMKITGQGSVESWLKLAAFKADLDEKQLRFFLDNLQQILSDVTPPSALDKVWEELKASYQDQELAAWAKLLLSKKKVEDELGITVKATLRKK